MIAIIDYGAGNLGSVYKAFRYIGADAVVTNDPAVVERADALVLPGVGAFGHCMSGLTRVQLTDATQRYIQSGRPFLGICVGLQMLFDESEEHGFSPGLGVLPGRVVRFRFEGGVRASRRSGVDAQSASAAEHEDEDEIEDDSVAERLKVPHIGWNELQFREDSALFRGLRQGERVYFVHSYYPAPLDETVVSAWSEYGGRFCCAVESGNVHATQFHPEKSGAVGLQILRNFATLAS